MDFNLPALQNHIKRDPASYREEFTRQLRHFEHLLEILRLDPSANQPNFVELVLFLSHVSHCYPKELKNYPQILMELLEKQQAILSPDVRKSLVQALMLLRSKKMVEAIPVLSLFFSLFKCRDKQLRLTLRQYIISDIKSANQKSKNNKLNKSLQNYMFSLISATEDSKPTGDFQAAAGDACDIAAKYSLDICIELYRKNIWNDAKTVSIIAEACFSPYNKVLVVALKFFLGTDEDKDEDSDEEDVPDIQALQFRQTITKKSRSAKTKMDKMMKLVKRKERKQNRTESFNFSAIQLINDPQGMAEKLFRRLDNTTTSKEIKFEIRLMIMNLVSRLIGLHKLILLSFYSYIVRYLKPHQPEVALILAICAQAAHDLTAPDAIESVIRTILDNFVTDALSAEVIAAGINSIREISSRCPFGMTEEMLSYLCTFKVHRDKGVMMATRGLITLYREVNPELLPKKERGKLASIEMQSGIARKAVFGQENVREGVDGAELLAQLGEAYETKWDVDEQESEEEADGWVKVSDEEPEPAMPLTDFVDKSEKRKLKNKLHLGLKLHEMNSEDDEAVSQDGSDFDGVLDEELGSDGELEEVGSDIEEASDNESEPEGEENITQEEAPKDARSKKRVDMERILTPADFARLKQLKRESEATRLADPRKRQRETSPDRADPHLVQVSDIIGYRKKRKATKEERIASIMEGRKDRPKYGSRKGDDTRGSLTNREKSKRKNNQMMVHKRSVQAKKKMSLRDKQIKLRKHIDRQKKQK